ncbi:hypothetical protein POM88_049863 [Heracleum sosnowskyi]|uniref:Uncharacterized protein n=1 Tax=Heracleum sosnowskyi TaxID=360622 RepID=A0AAD8GYX6_9APIA|nr:hypothetical protein POM88_049862 [Heracleum sosnowskyi]KAK1356607.1 hypothetical protein POM88_049863 [Heracleum sosnowskyi]
MYGGYNEYLEIEKELKVEKSKSKNAVEESSGFWWENSFEDLEMDELEIFVKSLEELKNKVADKADELRNSGSSPSLIDTNVGADELRNSGSSPSLIDTNVGADELRNSGSSVGADELRNSGSSPSFIDTNVGADELRNSVVSSPFDTNTNLSNVDGLLDDHVSFADLLTMPPFNYNSGGFDNNSFGNGDQLTIDDYQVSSAFGTPGDNY